MKACNQKTPIGLEKNGGEVDGVQKPDAHVALNQI
jgi:hypothetical protein